jgi:VanZ family protein
MAVIFFLSTDAGSAGHTSRILEPLIRWLKADISQQTVNAIHLYVRKSAHVSEYALLSILLFRALWALNRRGKPSFRYALVALLFAAAYAASDEYHQSFIPSREPSLSDVLIDTSGAFAGLCLVGTGLKLRESWQARRARKAFHSPSDNH